jgi:PHD/YefM family antitoxin component YafN of YafNO toxin-antitoxin module
VEPEKTPIARQRFGKHVSTTTNTHVAVVVVSTEEEESALLDAATKQRLVKTAD